MAAIALSNSYCPQTSGQFYLRDDNYAFFFGIDNNNNPSNSFPLLYSSPNFSFLLPVIHPPNFNHPLPNSCCGSLSSPCSDNTSLSNHLTSRAPILIQPLFPSNKAAFFLFVSRHQQPPVFQYRCTYLLYTRPTKRLPPSVLGHKTRMM